MKKEVEIVDYGSDIEIASQTIDGLRCKETVYIFSDTQLYQVKEKSNVPFYYLSTGNGYVLFPAKCHAINDKGTIVKTDYYPLAKRFAKKQIGIQNLTLQPQDEDCKIWCFNEWNNYEDKYIKE